MNYFIIGDIHGCYHTLVKLLKNKVDKDYLICVGDYIDRGIFPGETIQLLNEYLKKGGTTLLMGNHDFYYANYISGIKSSQEKYLVNDFKETQPRLLKCGINDNKYLQFKDKLLFLYEADNFIVSHAGINNEVFKIINNNPVIKNSPCGNASMEAEKIHGHNKTYLFENILLDRSLPDDLGKIQIHGHIPLMCFNPVFFPKINSWNLDTGAFLGWGMTAIRINDKGDVLNTFFERTDHRDIKCS